MTKFRLAIVATAFTALIGLAVANWYITLHRQHGQSSTVIDAKLEPGGPFTMVDQNGNPVTEAMLKGKWTAVFFGYTYCPDYCPFTLQSLAAVQKKLGDKGKNFQIVFVTIDPARDTPANLKAYLSSGGMPKDTIGLTGTQAQVDKIAKEYRTMIQRTGSGDTYSFQHGTAVYLMDPHGIYNSAYTYDLGADTMTKLIKDAMADR